VSRWWGEGLRVGLAPDRVELAYRRGWGREPEPIQVDCQRQAGQPLWQAAIAALDGALTELGGESGLSGGAAVVLSNHLVRYQVMAWQSEINGARELEQLARLQFERVFGDATSSWTLRCSEGGWGQTSLACAVDTALLGALSDCMSKHGLRLASLQPLLMAAYNGFRRSLPRNAALAIVEPGRLCLGLLADGCWVEVVSRRAQADAAEAVEQELATLAPETVPERVDVLLVGAGASWPEAATRPTRLLAPGVAGIGSLALGGVA